MNTNYFTGFDSIWDSDQLTTVFASFVDSLPHGSGIDCDWSGNLPKYGKYVYFSNSHHCMNENGMYEGYQDFTVRIPKVDFMIMIYGQWLNALDEIFVLFKETWGDATTSIIENFTIQFNNGHYLADKHMLKDYLEDTFAWALRDYFNSLV